MPVPMPVAAVGRRASNVPSAGLHRLGKIYLPIVSAVMAPRGGDGALRAGTIVNGHAFECIA
jgi:hypothetical protein